jgi:hypothetical protein
VSKEDTQFKKGNCANPGGRPKIPKDIRQALASGRDAFIRDFIEIENLTINKLRDIKIDTISVRKRAIIQAFLKNDTKALKNMYDRVYGKAKESIEFLGEPGTELIRIVITDETKKINGYKS